MGHVKKYILHQSATAGSAQLYENDKDNWMWLLAFFAQFHTLCELQLAQAPTAARDAPLHHFDVGYIASTIDIEIFAFLAMQIDAYLEAPAAHKKTSSLVVTVSALKSLVCCCCCMPPLQFVVSYRACVPPLQLQALDAMDVAGDEITKRASQVIQSNVFHDPNRFYILKIIELLRTLQPSSAPVLILYDMPIVLHCNQQC
jgi:hypothetical protein